MADRNVRKFIDLVRKASGKWANWDPPIPIVVGDYGTLNENGELDVLGNVYRDLEVLKCLKDNGVDLGLADNQPGFGEPETDFIVSSSGVKKGQLNVDQSVTIPHAGAASIQGTWKFLDGKCGALVILHSPCQTFIPKPVFAKLLKVDLLKDKHVVTSALACSAYLMYLSDKSGESFSVSFSAKVVGGAANSEVRAGWWTNIQNALLRKAFNADGRRCFIPIVSLRKVSVSSIPSWPRWGGTKETPGPTSKGGYPSQRDIKHHGELRNGVKKLTKDEIEFGSDNKKFDEDGDEINEDSEELDEDGNEVGQSKDESGNNAGQLTTALERAEELQRDPATSTLRHAELSAVQDDLRARALSGESKDLAIAALNDKVLRLSAELTESANEIRSLRAVVRAHEQKHECEVLYTQGHITDAANTLVEFVTTADEVVKVNGLLSDWHIGFTNRCISKLEITGDEALNVNKYDEAIKAYSTALCLSGSTPDTLLSKWAGAALARGSADDALAAATKFKHPKFTIFRAICNVLEVNGRIMEGVACFRQMQNKLEEDTGSPGERVRWEFDFRRRFIRKLEELCDGAIDSEDYEKAVEYLSAILSLEPEDRINILIKRSRARALMESWIEALSDADQVLGLSPSSHRGYELRHAALHGTGRYAEAVEAFDTMFSKMKGSPDVDELKHRYVDPRPVIQSIVEDVVRPIPRVLIDATTGRLCTKRRQEEAFKALPIYTRLVSSMTTELDEARIREAVEKSYQYVMFSHKWGKGEPLFQEVENISIYHLEPSPGNSKLQKFCSLARDRGFRWAWSDTCCIDKLNNVTLQESLVSMFTWYRGSSLTVVHLLGVPAASRQPGGLRGSIWNSRAWTYQEYVAAKVVLFYTEDWHPYLGREVPNHKELPDIVSEIQQATTGAALEMTMVQPGPDRVREKLFLASKRETTLEEDAAYSLFGIFNARLPVIYGERHHAVGRLLDYVLTKSGDVSVLAWTGISGTYNSCLPRDLTVYDRVVPPHIPLPMEKAKVDKITDELRPSLSDLSVLLKLHKRLNKVPLPSVAASRLRLPGIICSIANPVQTPELHSEAGRHWRIYHVETSMFGNVEIKTGEKLGGMVGLCLVYPWIRALLDQEYSEGETRLDKTMRALRLVARLRQPFGALLFVQLSRIEYRRVAADSLIMAQVDKEVSLEELTEAIRTIEVQ